MNRPELWLAAAAAAPVLSYFLGRLNRWAGAAAGAALFALCVFMLAGEIKAGAPFLALVLWTAAALAHSVLLNGRAGAVPDRSALSALSSRAAELQAELSAIKLEATRNAAGEKKSLAVYSAVKLLSETVEPQAAAKQLGKYLTDYFATGEVALYMSGAAGLELFAQGNKGGDLPALERLLELSGGFPAVAGDFNGVSLAPVTAGDQPLGLVALRAPGAAEDAARFAAEIAFALKRVILFRQVEWLSLTDGLTGLWRRSALDEKVREELRRAAAFKTTVGFMIADIDHFKRLNDTYGHQFGDAVLRRVAQLLRAGVYETDFVGRYGGEEFGIVLPRADSAGVMRKAETMRARIAAETFSQGLEKVNLTISIGIAHFPRDGSTPEELIAAADKALYAAKEGGRDRVTDAGSI
ncbi:MAG: GGDEF domain-containing protein [Elusimicrobiales bacterium]